MGMAASQARFLGLTARQNNVEFEGQQINQQRTMLSNQSANYYNDLLGMTVPTPPSVDSYTKTVYTFNDGSLSNTMTSMIAQSNGTYVISYLSKWQDDYTPVSAATSVIARSGVAGSYKYSIGAADLRELGSTAGGQVVGNSITKYGQVYQVFNDAGGYYIMRNQETTSIVPCTQQDINNFEYFYFNDDYSQVWQATKDPATGAYSYVDDDGNVVPVAEEDITIAIRDNAFDDHLAFVEQDANGDYVREAKTQVQNKEYLDPADVTSITKYNVGQDSYLRGKTDEEIQAILKEEEAWLKLLEQKYGNEEWLVRYVTDMTTGSERPYFYAKSSVENATYDAKTGTSLTAISCYTMGSEQKVQEFKGVEGCKIEKDSSGRFINLSIPTVNDDGSVFYTEYALTTETATDQDAYNDAMNDYEYKKYLYDQSVENINSKIEVIQAEDKNLELRLKQLDTEQKAISTEKEAVTKIIEKNTSDTFKTFGNG